MRNSLFGWLTGQLPAMVGAYWGADGVCLVQTARQSNGQLVVLDWVWQTASLAGAKGSEADAQGVFLPVKAMVAAVARLAERPVRLSLAVSSDEIFVKQVVIPNGLSEAQIAQIATVEAVANLPVPPEEICVDFVGRSQRGMQGNELLDIAFCRRAFADDIRAGADDAGVTLAVMDRDLQAVHDLAVGCLPDVAAQGGYYPFGAWLPESGRLVICQSALELSQYAVNAERDLSGKLVSRIEQMHACCRRCGLGGETLGQAIGSLVIMASGPENWMEVMTGSGCRVIRTGATGNVSVAPDDKPPMCADWPLIVATGMSFRANLLRGSA